MSREMKGPQPDLQERQREDFPGEYRASTRGSVPICEQSISTGLTGTWGDRSMPYYHTDEPFIANRISGKFVFLTEGKPPEFLLVEGGRIKRLDTNTNMSQNRLYLASYRAFRRVKRPDLQVVQLKDFPIAPPSKTK